MPASQQRPAPIALIRTLIVAVVFVFLTMSASVAAAEVNQAPGGAGCMSSATSTPHASCSTTMRGLKDLRGIAISPDGLNAYVAATPAEGGLLVFDRDPATGYLTQKAGAAGCIVEESNGLRDQTCATGRLIGDGWGGGRSIVVSPDGRNVYLVSAEYGSVSIFDRDTATGVLTQKAGTAGCIHQSTATVPADTGCNGSGRAMDALLTLAISPDGSSVYGATWAEAIVVFDRNASTGALTQKAGAEGCYVQSSRDSCTIVTDPLQLTQTQNLIVSVDGTHVYATSYTGGLVWTFLRDTTSTSSRGALGVVGCIKAVGVSGACSGSFRGLDQANDIYPSPDGSTLYVVGADGKGIAVLRRDADTGALTQTAGEAGCIADASVLSLPMWTGCATARGFGNATTASVLRLAVSASRVFVASDAFDAVAVLDRSSIDGSLSQSAAADGCLAPASSPIAPCTAAIGLDAPGALAFAGSPATLYVGASQPGPGVHDALTVFHIGAVPAPAPDPTPNPSPPRDVVDSGGPGTPQASATVAVGRLVAKSGAIRIPVTVSGPGRVTVVGTRGSARDGRAKVSGEVCNAAATVEAAGSRVISCVLSRATRAARARGPVKVKLVIRFTPTSGAAVEAAREIRLARAKARR
jgi:hypothetical protein